MPAQGFASIALKNEVMERIDEFLQKNRMGFTSRAEVVTAAVRDFLQRQDELELRRRQLEDHPMPTPEEVEKARAANRRAVERARAEDARRAREGR